MKNILIILIILTQALFAKIVAVLEVITNDENVPMTISESRHLTDELRKQAAETLTKDFSVLTRDNILQLLPPDEVDAQCLAESCAVEIGRAVGAEYVTQGTVGMFDNKLTLTVELYESMSGKLLGSLVTEKENVSGLLSYVRENSAAMFGKIPMPMPMPMPESKLDTIKEPIELEIPVPVSAKPEPLVPSPQQHSKFKKSMWVAIGLDVLSAAAFGVGIYQHTQKNKFYDEYGRLSRGVLDESEKHKASNEYDKAEQARKTRDAAFIIGGALLASGITLHIWF